MPHDDKDKRKDEEAEGLIEIVEKRMTAVKPQEKAEVAADDSDTPDPESFEYALMMSKPKKDAKKMDDFDNEDAVDIEMVTGEVGGEDIVMEEPAAEVEEAPVYTPEEAADLFMTTYGMKYDPSSDADKQKMMEIENMLVDMGGLGDKSPQRFALDIYRKYKY